MLLRHAKSAWPDGLGDDRRPLAERGRLASLRMGRYMAEQGLLPDIAVVSIALRAQQSWELAGPAFGRAITRHDEPRIYEASARAILDVVKQTAAEIRCLLLVGHNPGLQDLALKLIGKARPSDLAGLRRKFPTAALAVIDLEIMDWSRVSAGSGRLERFETPKSAGE